MKIVIGIDESYTNTGVALVIDGCLEKTKTIRYKHCSCKTEKRNKLRSFLANVLSSLCVTYPEAEKIIICERIRTFSSGFMSKSYLTSTGALIAVIVDTAYNYDIPVFSVDTRSWKSKIVGSSKGRKKKVKITKGKNKGKTKIVSDNKAETMKWVKKNVGIDVKGNDDLADAICIALYGFLDEGAQKLKLEN